MSLHSQKEKKKKKKTEAEEAKILREIYFPAQKTYKQMKQENVLLELERIKEISERRKCEKSIP